MKHVIARYRDKKYWKKGVIPARNHNRYVVWHKCSTRNMYLYTDGNLDDCSYCKLPIPENIKIFLKLWRINNVKS